ncbi:MAG TPA: lipid II flippase MurJ [Nitrospira sp.]|nr:lipid II flippase MurJ [Nitrospira sp.]
MATGVGGSSIIVSFVTVLTMGLGVLNQIVIAKYYGASAELDSYLIAAATPSIFSGVALTLFSSILVPSLTAIKTDREKFSEAVSTLTTLAVIGTIVLVLVGMAGKAFILELLTGLMGDDLSLAIRLAGYVWIGTGLSVLSSFFTSLHYLDKQFTFPALLGLLPTAGMMLGTVTLSRSVGIEGLVVGWLATMIVACLILLPIVFQSGFSLEKIGLGNRHAKEFMHALLPVTVGILPFTILPAIDAYWVSRLPEGSMAYLGYCARIVAGMGSLVMSGIYVVILPYLAENVAENDLDAFLRRLQLAIKYVLMVTIPIVTFFLFFGRDFVCVLFERGQFNEESTGAVATLLPFYLIGLLAMAPTTILSKGYLALKRYQGFGVLGVIVVAVYCVMAGVFSRYYSFYGIGLAHALYWTLFFCAGLGLLRRNVLTRNTLTATLKCAVCSIVSSAIASVVLSGSAEMHVGMTLLLEGCLAMVLFVLLAYFLRFPELRELSARVLLLIKKQEKYSL